MCSSDFVAVYFHHVTRICTSFSVCVSTYVSLSLRLSVVVDELYMLVEADINILGVTSSDDTVSVYVAALKSDKSQ